VIQIEEVLRRCRARRRAALIPYVMAGDPSLAALPAIVQGAYRGGADLLEIGIAFSDPLADGPVIQGAAARAALSGASFEAVIASVAAIDRAGAPLPLIAFTYYNPLFVRGLARSAAALAAAGFAGVIVPDLPFDEAAATIRAFASAGLGLVLLVTPTTPDERARAIVAASRGFVYVVSRMGVTGSRGALGGEIFRLVARLRSMTDKPVAVGFGIATPDHVREVAAVADGVVVGSALVDRIARDPARHAQITEAFCCELSSALDKM
jgi:tryptophan synthase alpha chain